MLHSYRYFLTSELRDTYLVCVTNSSIQTIYIGDQENSKKEADPIDQLEVRCDDLDATNTWTALTQQTDRRIHWDGFVAGVLQVPTDVVISVHLVNERHDNRAE